MVAVVSVHEGFRAVQSSLRVDRFERSSQKTSMKMQLPSWSMETLTVAPKSYSIFNPTHNPYPSG